MRILPYKSSPKFEEIYDKLSNQLKSEKKKQVWGHLVKEVIRTGKCIRCGACVSSCKVLDWDPEKSEPKLSGKCENCGVCYYQCPATKSNKLNVGIGNYIEIYGSKTKLPKEKLGSFQNGGTVSTIISYLLTEEKYDGAVVVVKDPSQPWYPVSKFITETKEIPLSSGTIYTHAQVMPELIRAIFELNAKKIAFIGTPCNIDALVSMYENETGLVNNIKDVEILKIGLFCMEAFVPESLYSHLETDDINLSRVSKMEVSNNKLKIFADNKAIKSYPIKELGERVDSSCHFCIDFTSEQADISVGNVGTPDDENTVIIRTEKGQKLFQKMIDKGYLDVQKLDADGLSKLMSISKNKKTKDIPEKFIAPKVQKDKFILHNISDWANQNYGFTPIVMEEKYQKLTYKEISINHIDDNKLTKNKLGEPSKIYIAKVPDVDGIDTIPYNYSSAYDLTIKMLKDYNKLKNGKVLLKPNNTGFVGVFKTDALKHILDKNGITDNADDQQIATQPSVLSGIVDALLELGVSRIDIGENMLWTGGTPRAFYETGYTKIFSAEKYKGKVFFIDFYENDPPASSLERLPLEQTDYCKYDYYDRCFPPKAIFEENYDLIYIASVVKTHNCSYYSLSVKNFSVSWNPRKKTGKIAPRWHIHGLPLNVFHIKSIKIALGDNFRRKYKYLVREVYKYPYKNPDTKERIVKKKDRKVIVTNEFSSSGLMNTIYSQNNYALDVDPHHWSGITLSIMNLGIGYLITRFNKIFSVMLKELNKRGTRVAALCSAVVGQELDGPLVYGPKKYGGFTVASLDHVALEKTVLDLMFGSDASGFQGFIVNYQKQLMKEYNIKDESLIKEAETMWTLQMLKDMIGGELDSTKMNMLLLDYTKSNKFDKLSSIDIYKLRRGDHFAYSKAFYVSPTTWLRVMHSDDGLAMNAFIADKKSIEIPLIPGVVK